MLEGALRFRFPWPFLEIFSLIPEPKTIKTIIYHQIIGNPKEITQTGTIKSNK